MKIFGFDYDGTIINIEPEKAQAFGDLLFHEWGINKQEAVSYWIDKAGTSRRHKFDYFYEKQFSEKLSDEKYVVIEPKLSTILKEKYYPKVKLLPHALNTIQFVRSHFDFVFISSGVPLEEIRYLVELNGISQYFDVILGTSDEYPTKREHFKEILSTRQPSLLFYIGDGTEDMKIANEFNAISIGLPTNKPTEVLQEAGAKYVCNLDEVIPLVESLTIKTFSHSEQE